LSTWGWSKAKKQELPLRPRATLTGANPPGGWSGPAFGVMGEGVVRTNNVPNPIDTLIEDLAELLYALNPQGVSQQVF